MTGDKRHFLAGNQRCYIAFIGSELEKNILFFKAENEAGNLYFPQHINK